jgi:hypothetical protein
MKHLALTIALALGLSSSTGCYARSGHSSHELTPMLGALVLVGGVLAAASYAAGDDGGRDACDPVTGCLTPSDDLANPNY